MSHQPLRPASHVVPDEPDDAPAVDKALPGGCPPPLAVADRQTDRQTARQPPTARPCARPPPGRAALGPPAPHRSDPQVAMLDRVLRVS